MPTKKETYAPGPSMADRIVARRRIERAAPELLVAVKALIEAWDNASVEQTEQAVRGGLAAIAKAEGR